MEVQELSNTKQRMLKDLIRRNPRWQEGEYMNFIKEFYLEDRTNKEIKKLVRELKSQVNNERILNDTQSTERLRRSKKDEL